jgi:hypothetical protein
LLTVIKILVANAALDSAIKPITIATSISRIRITKNFPKTRLNA